MKSPTPGALRAAVRANRGCIPSQWTPYPSEVKAALIIDSETGLPELVEALELVVREVECYCADNVAVRGPCGWCQARAALASHRLNSEK